MTWRRTDPPGGLPVGEDGYTLLETLVALALLALVVGSVAPALRGPSATFRLKRNARDVAATLRAVHAAAVAGNTPIAVVIDTETGRFGREGTPPRQIEPDIRLTIAVAAPERRAEAVGAVRFYPDGSATGLDLTLAIGAERRQVLVDWATGATRLGQAGG